jgi:hypothetical protein
MPDVVAAALAAAPTLWLVGTLVRFAASSSEPQRRAESK